MDAILRDRRAILVFVGPALLVYTLVLLGPILWSLGYTFFSGSIITGFKYVGLEQLQQADARPDVLARAPAFTLKYAVAVTVAAGRLGLLLLAAVRLLSAPGLRAVRTLVFFPSCCRRSRSRSSSSKLFADRAAARAW